MDGQLGYLPASSQSCASSVTRFLSWMSSRTNSLISISLADIDVFLSERRSGGWSHRTSINETQSLRTFFRYAESRGWSAGGLSRTVRVERAGASAATAMCPSWEQVCSLLAALDCSGKSHCRAKAILLLAARYGLRRSELVRLTLDDLDWRDEVLTVRRSKRGRIQQFPLEKEVGDAIIRYVSEVRPSSRFRQLFLTLQKPHRPAVNLGSAMRKLMNSQKVFDRDWGLHSLRHACATELLRKGTSLKAIADFLGRRGLQSVSIYAHSDYRALARVAEADLGGVL
ncbi:tyrosine-type recombinase/integrase [Terriglobus roseus]